MTTVAHGPYEHVGAYGDLAESERFDTSGTPEKFCPECEHAPCVAGRYTSRCGKTPHFLSVCAAVREIGTLLESFYDNPLWQPLTFSVHTIQGAAFGSGHTADVAMKRLGELITELRKAKEAQS